MRKIIILLFLTIISACGRREPVKSPVETVSSLEQLQAKSKLYSQLIDSHRDADGFIMTEECDATFFSGLLGAALPGTVNIAAATDGNGQYFRRPGHDCGPAFSNSRSTISRDQMLGVMWHMWRNRDVVAATQLMEQLQADNYILKGDGTPGELLFIPAYVNTLAEMIYKLGGHRYEAELALPAVLSGGEDYEAHLAVMHILLRGEIIGSIPDFNFQILQKLAEDNSRNPLFQAAYHRYLDGNYTSAVQLLMDDSEWPADHLPTSVNHCDNYPVQRSYTDRNWSACRIDNPVEHTGAELIVITNLVIADGAGDVR
jgi:hypothetical protein